MIENGMYFGKPELYDLIRNNGGQWNDSKERPLFCCVESREQKGLYWAIPVGNWDHRSDSAKLRIQSYINRPEKDIASCYYHLGRTDVRSIFFISDAIPITDKYIDREYINHFTSSIHIVRNSNLISELNRKLSRILAYENSKNNYFRQHISDVKKKLISELNNTSDLN